MLFQKIKASSIFTEDKKIDTIEKISKVETVLTAVFMIMTFIAFGYIAVMSLIQTSTFDPENYGLEVILYNFDNIAINVVMLILFAVSVFSLNKTYNFFAKINMKMLYGGLFLYVTVLGLLWIFSVWQVPGADSANIFETATEVIKGDYSSLRNYEGFYFSEYYNEISYYNYYPFQLGFVFLCEVIYRIFGTDSSMPVQVINVIALAFAYCGIARITKIIFKRKSIEFFSIILLLTCFQPILFCTFAYGNIIGMSCCIWASYFLIRYFQNTKLVYILPCAILLTVGVLAKYNSLIYLAAFVILLLIHTICRKKLQNIVIAIVLCFVSVCTSNLVIAGYENRADVKLEEGVSQILYLGMGMNESFMAPGWYDGKYMGYYRDNGCDSEIASRLAKEDIAMNLEKFADDIPYAVSFFGKKILSQWNEPTYASIWISKTKAHTKEPNSFANSVYDGNTGQFFEMYFNQYMQIIFVLFSAGLICLIIKKKCSVESVLLPLVLLGAFGYHLLFEAKSQYALTYIILLIPIASYGIQSLLIDNADKLSGLIDKLKTAHIKTEE